MFRIDPIDVLNADKAEWVLRLAAANVIAEDEKKQAEQQRAKSRRGASRPARGRRR